MGTSWPLLACLALATAPLALAAPATPASSSAALSPQQLIANLESAQQDLKTLSADFTQISRVKLFKQELHSTGRLLYLKGEGDAAPSRLRWEYLRPDPSTLLLVGGQARLQLGNLPPQIFDTARDATLRAIFTQLRLWLGAGTFADAKDEYDLRSGGSTDRPALLLSPRPSSPLAKTFSRVELHLDGRSWQVARLLLVEQSGDEKEILFSHVKRNQTLPLKLFQPAP
jgi:outer membrane lipoprotein-sorting protein